VGRIDRPEELAVTIAEGDLAAVEAAQREAESQALGDQGQVI
jgi:hypothetical protein